MTLLVIKDLLDIDGSKFLNDKLIHTVNRYKPNLIILGHADLIRKDTKKIKKFS